MKVLAFAASNSKQSINKALVQYAASTIDFADVEFLDINDFEMPLFSPEREAEYKAKGGEPAEAKAFHQKISEADALLISFAEHNGCYTAAFKNLFDWTSRIDMKVYQNKPMVMLATSPGPGGAKNVLNLAVTSSPYFGGDVKGSLSVPSFMEQFDTEAGKLTNEALVTELSAVVQSLQS
ncbi:MAG: NAD(P)H-dependent oxidoreductase [Cellvibrionales bacterium]|nr:NAD(P)H-dependent oxidoreductase [Cellvibrionales bacterium]